MIINFAVRVGVIPQIDNPIVRCPTVEIPTFKTDFIYSDFLKRRRNFHIDVDNELINTKLTSVQPNTELKIIFNHEYLHYSLFKRLENGNYEKIFDSNESTNGTFITPDKPGKYLFSISADYDEGLGIYYFLIEVNEK